jgi:hypothetical protein
MPRGPKRINVHLRRALLRSLRGRGVANACSEMSAEHVRVNAPAGQLTQRRTRRVPPARRVWPVALAVATVVLFLCYLRLSGTRPENSDGADQALQAWNMLHGNWLLRGWTVGDVSYYTTELPEYIIVEMIRGFGPGVVHVAAAITYTLLVLLAALLAKGSATGREGLLRVLIASGILLAPQLGHGVSLLLLSPDHIGTQVPLLVIFIVLDRAPRRWYTVAAITVMLTWVIIADRVAVFDAALPLVVVCGLRAGWAIVHDRKRPAAVWFELSLVVAGIVSFVVSQLVVAVIEHTGGYTSLPLPTQHFVATGDIPHHLWITVRGIFTLYGADFGGASPGAAVLAVVHLVGLVLALWALCRAFRRFFADDLIVPVIATGIVFNLAAYIISVTPVTWFDTREIAAVLPFGAVLAGRLLARTLDRAWLRPVLAGVLACYAVALGYGAAQPPAAYAEQSVLGWLEAHQLSTGLGAYGPANLITLESGGRVAIRTVTWHLPRPVPRAYESEASWYDPRLNYANFVISTADPRPGHDGFNIPPRDVLALAGPPAHTYHYGIFIIWTWNRNLLADLGGPPSPWPGDVG